MLIREVTNQEIDQFNNLAPHIVQSWEWGQFRLKTNTVPKILRLGAYDGPNLVRAYQIFFHKTPAFNKLIAYLPRSPLPPADDLESIKKSCLENDAVFLKIEPDITEDLKKNDALIKSLGFIPGKRILPVHTAVVDLTRSEQEIMGAMHEKTRYNIKVAQKHGVMVLEKNDPESLSYFIKLYDATQKRQGFYAKSGDYIRTLWKTLEPTNMVHLLCAYIPNMSEPLASLMIFNFNDTTYFPYGGWSSEHREMMPNNLLQYEAIRLSKLLGAKKYDFWSSYKDNPVNSDPWYGTYVFKKGFGPSDVHYVGAYDYVFNSTTYSLLNIADKARWALLKLKR